VTFLVKEPEQYNRQGYDVSPLRTGKVAGLTSVGNERFTFALGRAIMRRIKSRCDAAAEADETCFSEKNKE
jgi:hypothetical protein